MERGMLEAHHTMWMHQIEGPSPTRTKGPASPILGRTQLGRFVSNVESNKESSSSRGRDACAMPLWPHPSLINRCHLHVE